MRIYLLLVIIAFQAAGQQKQIRFKLPQNAAGQYASGTVLVKLKPENKGIDVSRALRSRDNIKAAKSFVPEKQQAKLRMRTAPRASTTNIDLALYAEINYEGTDIESFINDLYTTELFEIIEPDYIAKLSYAPTDPNKTSQYYLDRIKAYQAWDITKGSPNVVIGIVDSGGDLDHPDIASQLYQNMADPVNGVDDDNDGYIDNYRGWDFMGTDTLNANRSNFLGDNDPSNPNGGLGSHGTAVAGCAAAATDNSTGISGVGFNSKLLFTKQAADNQGTNVGSVYRGYSGILYAATHGAKIINCSWGGYVFSQIQQDLITYVTLDLGCLVVAAAGNNNTGVPHYPSAYEHVLSVAASGPSDVRATFSNFGSTIDIIAPGDGIFTTFFNNTYNTVDGTSFSAPIVSGAAALVWAQNPSFTAIQVAEQIRLTADESVYDVNPGFKRQLGKGRLDIFRALTKQFPAIRAFNPKLLNASGAVAEPGQDAFLTLSLRNYLATSSSGLTVTLTPVTTGLATVTAGTILPGSIAGGATVNNQISPFKLKLSNNLAQNTTLSLVLTYTDGEYTDYQYVSFMVNPSFLDIDENQIITTIASNGRLGFEQTANQSNGVGFVFDDNRLLFEMGLIMGNGTKLFDNVRSINNNYNQEFISTQKIKEITPGERSSSEIYGAFTDNASTKTVSVQYRSLAWKEVPRDRFVILEYRVKNVSGQPINNFHFGLFADWDITDNGGKDVAAWDAPNQLGYVRPAQADDKPHAGIAIVKGISAQHYAIDNNQSTPGAPFGLYDGFTDSEKLTALTSGIGRAEAGTSTGTGADVSHLVGAGPYNLASDEEVVLAFALVAAPSLTELQEATQQAHETYNVMLNATRPTAAEVQVCYGSPATLQATGVNQFKWYRTFTGGEPITDQSTFTTGALLNDTVFYVSNADANYESVRTIVPVKLLANPKLITLGSGTICDGNTLKLSVAEADSYLWNTGATTQSIEVAEAGTFSVYVETTEPSCSSNSEEFQVAVNPAPVASFEIEGDLTAFSPIQFNNTTTGAISYQWMFGDNRSSTLVSPSHQYNNVREYNVTLTATNEFGCTHAITETILIVTSAENPKQSVVAYPVPSNHLVNVEHNLGACRWSLVDSSGKVYLQGSATEANRISVDTRSLAAGVYLITLSNKTVKETIRIIKAED